MRTPALPALLLAPLAALALACAAPPAEVAPAPTAAPSARAVPVTPANVFDAAGHAAACARPEPSCPATPPDTAFRDRCRLAGYRVVQCGCEARCTGDVSAAPRAFDAAGTPKTCAPATEGCTPPAAGAAFQDACAEKGHRLVTCGCEWLCSGKPR